MHMDDHRLTAAAMQKYHTDMNTWKQQYLTQNDEQNEANTVR